VNLAQLLISAARSFHDRPALSIGAKTLFDYGTLGRRAAGLAASLKGGLAQGSGDRVALAMSNCPEYLEILFACWHAGLAVVPMNARLHAGELAFMVEDSNASLIFATEALAQPIAAACPGKRMIVAGSREYAKLVAADGHAAEPVGRDDLAWIFYTSGTTGKPKGAMLSHGNLMAMAIRYLADVDMLAEDDALLHLAATSHASGLFALSHVAKGSNNILPESGGYDAEEVGKIIDATPNLTFFVPPTLLRRMTTDEFIQGAKLSNIRTVLVGAAPVSAQELRDGLATFGPTLWHGYGQGESPCTITAMSKRMIAAASIDAAERLASVGIERTGIEVRIADADDNPVGRGEIGEVLVRGDTVMSGYWNRPRESVETLRGGWLHTGDLGSMDRSGYLMLLDRKKDLIISGGMNIYAREIEDILLTHPGVAEAAVIGVPDAEWGESVAAILVAADGESIDPRSLDRLCLATIARYKRPKRYEFVTELPKNAAGKVLKRELRDTYGAASIPAGGSGEGPPVI
jgi:long-chain acyl-CoA synthetase